MEFFSSLHHKQWVVQNTSCFHHIHYEAPVEEQNFSTLIEMINSMEVREDDEEFKNAVDLMFDELKEREPNHFAVRQYVKYKLAAGKTAKSILVSCGARLAVFDIAELREVTSYDELELDTLGDRRTALFLIMSDTDDSFNFLISMCYTQLFNLLCEKADDVYGGRLPVHVRCLIDECANIGQIPKLEKLVATIRSREISACLVLQAQSQLKAIYKDNADTIIGNMDSSIFLGGKEPTTLKELEAVLGKETIDTYNTGESRGRETSHSLNYQKLGKALMSQDELAVMDGGKCILQLRGVRPFLSDKYDITQHPNYKYTADADPKNAFDIEGYEATYSEFTGTEILFGGTTLERGAGSTIHITCSLSLESGEAAVFLRSGADDPVILLSESGEYDGTVEVDGTSTYIGVWGNQTDGTVSIEIE